MNGFITLSVQPTESESDFAVDQIAAYVLSGDANGNSVLFLATGNSFVVKESVPEIRALIAAEKGT